MVSGEVLQAWGRGRREAKNPSLGYRPALLLPAVHVSGPPRPQVEA